jgi:8-oxo-dGTP pyrophosphatase MutT (NUDIX family)
VSPIDLLEILGRFEPRSEEEAADLERLRQIAGGDDPWSRSTPIHATGSAIIVHPPTRRVLLRWHERMQAWLQVGGHADSGETNAFDIALREAREETGLPDLSAWPDPQRPTLVQVTIVPVPAGKGEPAHHHADLRYILSTENPDATTPESEHALLRWLYVEQAIREITEENLRICLLRVAEALQLAANPHPLIKPLPEVEGVG